MAAQGADQWVLRGAGVEGQQSDGIQAGDFGQSFEGLDVVINVVTIEKGLVAESAQQSHGGVDGKGRQS